MLKTTVLFGFFFLFTAMLWALGLGPKEDEALLKYLIFATQLLYGNMCYDLLKVMREIPSDDSFWHSVSTAAGEAAAWMIFAIALLALAANAFLFAYVGLIAALLAYGAIFVRVLPRLQPIYVQAQSRKQEL